MDKDRRSSAEDLKKSAEALRKELDARMQTEEELKQSEDRFSRIFKSSPIPITLNKLHDGTFIDANERFMQLTGFARAEVIGHTPAELGLYPDIAVRSQILKDLKDNGGFINREITYRAKSGRLIETLSSLEVITLNNEPCVLGFVLDITERKLAEAKLQQSLTEMTALNVLAQQISADITLDKIVDVSLSGISRLIRPDLVLIFKRNGEDLELLRSGPMDSPLKLGETPLHHVGDCLCGFAARSGKPVYSINIHSDTRCTWAECKKAGIRSFAALPLMVENQVLGVLGLASGTEVDFEKQGSFLEVISAEIALGMKNALLIDKVMRHADELEKEITERKRAEEELRLHKEHLEDLVEERTGELAAANERLKEIDRLKSMFIASMSHELRTPLNSVIGFSSIMLNEWIGALNDEQKKCLSSILRSGKHLLALINDVIDVSKIEAGMIEVSSDEFDLAELLTEVEQAFAKEAQDSGLSLDVQSLHLSMHTDRRRLLQCVFNLVSNAIKYTELGGVKVTVRHDQDRGTVAIAVTDTGIGIVTAEQTNLFLAFSRIQSHLSAKVPGTGLGLYLTRKITVEILHGAICVASEPGRGSTFSITIPCRVEEEQKQGQAGAAAEVQS